MSFTNAEYEMNSCMMRNSGIYDPQVIIYDGEKASLLTSNYSQEHQPVSKYSPVYPVKFTKTIGDNLITFECPGELDMLDKTYFEFTLPELKLKDEHRDLSIRWCKNIGHHVIRRATFSCGDLKTSYDSVWLDIYFQFYEKNKSGYSRDIGNRSHLIERTNHLKQDIILFEQRWTYCDFPSSSVPLFMLDVKTIKHIFEIEDSIFEFLIVEKLCDDGTYKTIKPNSDFFENWTNNETISSFNLYGEFKILGEEEKRFFRETNNGRSYFYDQVKVFESTNITTLGESVNIPINTVLNCKCLFWLAENQVAKYVKNMSVYHTSKYMNYGEDPISHTSMKYSSSDKFIDIRSEYFKGGYIRSHFSSEPEDEGYHAFVYSDNSSSNTIEFGPILTDKTSVNLTVTLKKRRNQTNLEYHENDYDELVYSGSSKINEALNLSFHDIEPCDDYIVKVRVLTFEEFKIVDKVFVSV